MSTGKPTNTEAQAVGWGVRRPKS